MSTLSDEFPMMLEVETDQRNGMQMQNCPPVQVAFGLAPLINDKKSKLAGHDVFDDVEFVKIAIPGERSSLYFQPSSEVHHKRFPKSYAAYKQRSAGVATKEGMPIENWAPVSRSLALTMKAAHIHTVEALAAVHEGHIDKLGFNAREMRAKAQAWLKEAKDGAATIALAAEKQQLQDQLKAMEAQMAAMFNAMPQSARDQMAAAAKPVAATPDTTTTVEADVIAAARRPRAGARASA